MIKYNDNFADFDSESLTSILNEAIEKAKSCADNALISKVDTLIGTYIISTGEDPFPRSENTYMTIIVIKTPKKNFGPIQVQNYYTQSEAIKNHNTWLKIIKNHPPLILKDIVNKTIFKIPYSNK